MFICIAVLLVLFAGCKQPVNPFSGETAGGGEPAIENLPAEGFTSEMAVRFGLGVYNPADITDYYGLPDIRDNAKYASETVVTLDYSGFRFQFDGGTGEGNDATLFYAEVRRDVVGPNGIQIGMTIGSAADKIYAGAGKMIANPADYQLDIYGGGDGMNYGRYTFLDVEDSSAGSVYGLEFSTIDAEGKRILLIMNFNNAQEMTAYTIQRFADKI